MSQPPLSQCTVTYLDTSLLSTDEKINKQVFLTNPYESKQGNYTHSSTHFLTHALDRGEWLTSRPGRLTPRNNPGGPQVRTERLGEE
jgi:hypothetical protein